MANVVQATFISIVNYDCYTHMYSTDHRFYNFWGCNICFGAIS